jgi:hypothetical protein
MQAKCSFPAYPASWQTSHVVDYQYFYLRYPGNRAGAMQDQTITPGMPLMMPRQEGGSGCAACAIFVLEHGVALPAVPRTMKAFPLSAIFLSHYLL